MTDHRGDDQTGQEFHGTSQEVKISRSNVIQLHRNNHLNDVDHSLIDPVWIAMLTLYIKKNRSMACHMLVKKFADELPSSSIERYFHFMHEMNLVETKSAQDGGSMRELTLTPRGVQLVEDGLREYN